MNKKVLYLSKHFLIGVLALQFLNMSVCSEAYSDDDYDYSYSYNKGYDPTETAVELIIEMKYGQQPAFTYDHQTDTNKNIARSFHWHPYLQSLSIPAFDRSEIRSGRGEKPPQKTMSPWLETVTPPPEGFPA